MPKVFTSERQKIGKLGEDLAKRFLMKHGYSILEENYTKKYGEIDLIAKKSGKVHFIEVKSIVTRDTGNNVSRVTGLNVPRETPKLVGQAYNPMENVHPAKLKRLSRVIQVYLVTHETDNWQFDVILVKINEKDRVARVEHIKDLVI